MNHALYLSFTPIMDAEKNKKNLAHEDTRLPFLLKELLWQNQHFVTKWFHTHIHIP